MLDELKRRFGIMSSFLLLLVIIVWQGYGVNNEGKGKFNGPGIFILASIYIPSFETQLACVATAFLACTNEELLPRSKSFFCILAAL